MELAVVSPPCGQQRGYIDVKNVTGGTAPYKFLYGNLVVPGGAHIPHLLPGKYAITVVDANECTYVKEATVVEPKGFNLSVITPDVEIEIGDSVQLEVRVDVPKNRIDTVLWSPANYLNIKDMWRPWAKPKEAIPYYVTAIDSTNCKDSAVIWVNVRYPEVYIPNAFSPHNGDGYNDVFMIFAHENNHVKVNYLEIFDRWGNRVFTVKNFKPNDVQYGWNGTFNGRLMSPAVFVYVTEIEYVDGKKRVLKGDVTLFGN